ncbi:MAG: radical SAM protein [Deltaproteobacteria bacterium]|nr:radical SAM protein [Deltaproteobacteria bacterium]
MISKDSIKTSVKKHPLLYALASLATLATRYEGRTWEQKLQFARKKYLQYRYSMPYTIAFEPISHCVLNCEFCILQELKWWKYRKKARMTLDEFKKILDDISWFTTDIQFSGGEPILNPDIFRMLRYCREQNIYTLLPTNGILLNHKNNIEDILRDPPDKLLLAYESVSQDNYERIRRKANDSRGDFDKFMSNIQSLIAAKKKSGQKYPIIILQMVLTKKNQHEVELFWKSVKELEADYGSIKALGIWPEGNPEYDKKMIEEYIVPLSENPISRHDIDQNGNVTFLRKPGQCPAIKHCYIGSGGEVIPCWYIIVKTKVMGNALEQNFVDIWNSTDYKEYRQKMLHEWANSLCHRCIGIGATGQKKAV